VLRPYRSVEVAVCNGVHVGGRSVGVALVVDRREGVFTPRGSRILALAPRPTFPETSEATDRQSATFELSSAPQHLSTE